MFQHFVKLLVSTTNGQFEFENVKLKLIQLLLQQIEIKKAMCIHMASNQNIICKSSYFNKDKLLLSVLCLSKRPRTN